MLMADTMAIFFSVLGFMLALIGLWLLSYALWPEKVTQASERSQQSFLKPFLTGLPITGIALLIFIACNNLLGPLGKIVSIGIVCLFMCYTHLGVAALAHRLGRRLAPTQEAEQPWRTTTRGGVVLVLAYLLPIIGWFFILPITFIIGCGLTTLSLRRRKQPKPLADSVPPLQSNSSPFTLDNSLPTSR